MSETLAPCPECASEFTYELNEFLACSMCGHEWNAATASESAAGEDETVIRDAVGNVLVDGDTVTVIRDLKVRGSSNPIKVGTKVRNIRLVSGFDGHDIDCRVDGFGPMQLKSSVVKKA
jgi:protein PhnA